MRSLSRTLVLSALSLAVALPSIAQQAASRGIPGFLNPQDGSFHPRRTTAAPDATGPTLTTYNGEFQFTFSINLITKVPAGQQVSCEVSAGGDDYSSTGSYSNFLEEEASAVATISGSKATCFVKIPYLWQLANGPTDVVGLSYSVFILPTSTQNLTNFLTRESDQGLPSIPVPSPGSSTVRTIDVNI